MPGFMPGIHVFFQPDVDGRDERIEGLPQQRADTAASSGYITPARHVRAFCV